MLVPAISFSLRSSSPPWWEQTAADPRSLGFSDLGAPGSPGLLSEDIFPRSDRPAGSSLINASLPEVLQRTSVGWRGERLPGKHQQIRPHIVFHPHAL